MEISFSRVTVFHRDIQTPRRDLKIRRAAEYFLTKFEVFGYPDETSAEDSLHCLFIEKNFTRALKIIGTQSVLFYSTRSSTLVPFNVARSRHYSF